MNKNQPAEDSPPPRRGLRLAASTLVGALAAAAIFSLLPTMNAEPAPTSNVDPNAKTELATFGGGCFWCLEAFFERVDGVKAVVSGYTGGQQANPTYREVCNGTTGHAEVVQIEFDPNMVSYDELVDLFWRVHDPTQLNRQGNDVGTQYRSAIFYNDEAQKKAAESAIARAKPAFDAPIVTEVSKLGTFYPAEDYHQNYYDNNRSQPYCMYVVRPKLSKLPESAKK